MMFVFGTDISFLLDSEGEYIIRGQKSFLLFAFTDKWQNSIFYMLHCLSGFLFCRFFACEV